MNLQLITAAGPAADVIVVYLPIFFFFQFKSLTQYLIFILLGLENQGIC